MAPFTSSRMVLQDVDPTSRVLVPQLVPTEGRAHGPRLQVPGMVLRDVQPSSVRIPRPRPQLFGLTILCSVLTAGVLLIGAYLSRDSEPGGIVHAPVPAPGSPPLPVQRGPVVHTNLLGRYVFTYPRTWTIEEEGAETQLASPDGGTVLSFGSGETLRVGNGASTLEIRICFDRSERSSTHPCSAPTGSWSPDTGRSW